MNHRENGCCCLRSGGGLERLEGHLAKALKQTWQWFQYTGSCWCYWYLTVHLQGAVTPPTSTGPHTQDRKQSPNGQEVKHLPYLYSGGIEIWVNAWMFHTWRSLYEEKTEPSLLRSTWVQHSAQVFLHHFLWKLLTWGQLNGQGWSQGWFQGFNMWVKPVLSLGHPTDDVSSPELMVYGEVVDSDHLLHTASSRIWIDLWPLTSSSVVFLVAACSQFQSLLSVLLCLPVWATHTTHCLSHRIPTTTKVLNLLMSIIRI